MEGIGVNRGSGLGHGHLNNWITGDRINLSAGAAGYWAQSTHNSTAGDGGCWKYADVDYGMGQRRKCPCGSVIRGHREDNFDCTPECCAYLRRRRNNRRGFYAGCVGRGICDGSWNGMNRMKYELVISW
jgi:hypothetical protein